MDKEIIEFELGNVYITTHLDNECKKDIELQMKLIECFNRYRMNDWGILNDDDKKLNDLAVRLNNDRILAKYHIDGLSDDIYIITEYDRSVTTLLFCGDY